MSLRKFGVWADKIAASSYGTWMKKRNQINDWFY